MTLRELFGVGLTLSLISGLALVFEYSRFATTWVAHVFIHSDAPGGSLSERRASSRALSWGVHVVGHLCLFTAAIWTLI